MTQRTVGIRIGVDTGGTFTDFVIFQSGKIITRKILSTPRDPSRAILKGIEDVLNAGAGLTLIHGTTVATNALLERKGGRIALIATEGFEDILFIGRQTRRNLYSLTGEQRQYLLPRSLCFGVRERTSAKGELVKEVSGAELRKIIEKIATSKVEAVAVSFIHSYANSSNEDRVGRLLKKKKLLASVSSRILPEHREYERTVAAAVNAYLMPVISHYLQKLQEGMRSVDLRIMQSNEGYISAAKAREEPIRTALSGPAGGVVGALNLGRAAGFENLISFDMGGTSTDVSLIEGNIRRTNESHIGGFPVRIPIIDIHSVGAGGGSIAFVDSGGSLRVGPQSAGADPGPACYGQGSLPTVTDANLLLGRLDPDFFLGGKMKIYPERSLAAVKKLAREIRKPALETAQGIIDVANANMEKAIKVISIERGFDTRRFTLFSFGGAGGLHAVDIAFHLYLPRVIVPKDAGVLSALGLLLADSIKDYSCSILKTSGQISEKELNRHFSKLAQEGIKDMREDGFRAREIFIHRSLDLRYLGQSYEITLPYRTKSSCLSDFQEEHRRLYSYIHPQRPVEIVNLRVKAVGVREKIFLEKLPGGKKNAEDASVKIQSIYYQGNKYKGKVYNRTKLSPGCRIKGPALAIDFGSTTFLPPGCILEVDGYLNMIIEKSQRTHG
jgi:N-methylhydantoinase A/oxoprolinase/acetone carboxylase beta subunit